MNVCDVWLGDDYLHRHGFTITVHGGGRRTAVRDGATHVLSGVCRHDPADCPPHNLTAPARQAA